MSLKVFKNSQGRIFYGMHFYPGVAEYQNDNGEAYRVFLNENTLRAMDPTFAGRPIYVEHVDEVEEDLDELRKEVDGWVIESFYNKADGKHWVKFIAVSERSLRAIKNGFRLSNAYVPKRFGNGGLWNGVEYAKEITEGEFEHLAIVGSPRYEESVIMTPEEFKRYNADQVGELDRLANSNDKENEGEKQMGLKLFKRAKVENALDIEGIIVVLPKSGKEVAITQLVNEADDMEDKKKKNEVMAGMDHKVKLHDGTTCNVAELVEKHKALSEAAASKENEDGEIADGEKEVGDRGGDKSLDNMEEDDSTDVQMDESDDADKEVEAAKKKNSLEAAKKAKAKAAALRNARDKHDAGLDEEVAVVDFSASQVERGKSRYGS